MTRIRALRDPTQPPLLRNAARMSYRDLTFSKIPSLLPLAAMLFFLRFDVHARTWMALAGTLAGGLLCAMALVWLLDKRLLAWTRFISDESFVAAVLLGGGAALLLFVGLVVGLGAIFDGLKLAETLFGLIQESVRGDTEWGRWFEESLLEVRNMTLGTLHTSIGEEHFVGRRWLLVAEHFVEEAGAERNGTLLLESTITKMADLDGEGSPCSTTSRCCCCGRCRPTTRSTARACGGAREPGVGAGVARLPRERAGRRAGEGLRGMPGYLSYPRRWRGSARASARTR